MEFELIDYRIFKIKYMLKYTRPLFLFNGTRLQSKNWLTVEQALKLIKLNYHKIYNISSNMVMRNSIFKNSTNLLINGSTFFITLKSLEANTNLPLVVRLLDIHTYLTYLSTKINNKMYSNYQMQQVNFTSYSTNLLIFCYLLKISIKQKFTKISRKA